MKWSNFFFEFILWEFFVEEKIFHIEEIKQKIVKRKRKARILYEHSVSNFKPLKNFEKKI